MSETPRTDAAIAQVDDAEGPLALAPIGRQLEADFWALADNRDCLHLIDQIGKLTTDLAAMTAQRDGAIRERGTLLATEQGPTPIGQMLSDMEQRALAAEARALAKEKDAERWKEKARLQRRELRRLNKVLGPYWAGFRKGLGMEAEGKLRLTMIQAFGSEKVRAAEHAASRARA